MKKFVLFGDCLTLFSRFCLVVPFEMVPNPRIQKDFSKGQYDTKEQ